MSDRMDTLMHLYEALSQQDWVKVRELFSEDAYLVEGARRATDPQARVSFFGIEEIISFFREETAGKDQFTIRPTGFMEDGDRVAMFWEARRVDPGSMQDTVTRGVDVFSFRNGLIAGGRVYIDLAPEIVTD